MQHSHTIRVEIRRPPRATTPISISTASTTTIWNVTSTTRPWICWILILDQQQKEKWEWMAEKINSYSWANEISQQDASLKLRVLRQNKIVCSNSLSKKQLISKWIFIFFVLTPNPTIRKIKEISIDIVHLFFLFSLALHLMERIYTMNKFQVKFTFMQNSIENLRPLNIPIA